MCSAIFFRITDIFSTRSSIEVAGDGANAGDGLWSSVLGLWTWGLGLGIDAAPFTNRSCGLNAAPVSIKFRMSCLVTRPLIPLPGIRVMSTPCSFAILRTSGLLFCRRNSSTVAPFPPVVAVSTRATLVALTSDSPEGRLAPAAAAFAELSVFSESGFAGASPPS
jgi:hypothetical protein